MGLKMTLRKHPVLQVTDRDGGYTMEFRLTIENGNITVDCNVENYEFDVHYTPILVRAIDLANASVNLAAFSMGLGATVILETSIEKNGDHRMIILRDRPLAQLCTCFSHENESYDVILEHVFSDLRISRAVRDLTESIAGPHLIPANCARSMETLRNLISPEAFDRKRGWVLMQEHLRLTEGYLKLVTDHGVGPRHGDHQYVPAENTRLIADRSWTIMNRFLEYKKRGGQPLPLDEFPILAG